MHKKVNNPAFCQVQENPRPNSSSPNPIGIRFENVWFRKSRGDALNKTVAPQTAQVMRVLWGSFHRSLSKYTLEDSYFPGGGRGGVCQKLTQFIKYVIMTISTQLSTMHTGRWVGRGARDGVLRQGLSALEMTEVPVREKTVCTINCFPFHVEPLAVTWPGFRSWSFHLLFGKHNSTNLYWASIMPGAVLGAQTQE